MTMIGETSHSVPGVAASKSKAGVGATAGLHRMQAVETPTVEDEAMSPRDAGLSAPVEEQKLEGIVEHLNHAVQMIQRQLQFSVDEDSGKTVIKVIDSETDEVVRQLPPEDILNMQKHLGEMNGLLFQSEA